MPSGTNVTITIKKDDGTSAKKTFAVYNGHSAYEIWLMAGNIGDKDEFLASLKGEKGDTGPKGDPGDAGGFTDLPNSTILDTVTTPGGYIVNGADNWSALKYPFPVAVGNKVMMIVSTVKSGTFDNVIQTFFATNLSGRPGSQVRVWTSSGWGGWSGLVDFDFLDKNFLKVPNMSQLGLNISSTTGSVPSIYSYQKPTDDGSAPDIAFAPSSNPGLVFSLP